MTNTDVTKMAFFAVKDPKLITIDLADLNNRHKQLVAERAQNTPPPDKADLRKEYNQLRQRLFNLKQDAKCFEQRTNDAAGKIRLIEQHISETIALKKAASDAGNLRGERTYEQAILRLESELVDAQEDFTKNRNWNTQAARALKSFDGHGRIAELTAILDTPLPEKK